MPPSRLDAKCRHRVARGASRASQGDMRTRPHAPDGSARQVRPFTVATPDEVLEDLRARLAHTRWPADMSEGGWDYGLSLPYMRELLRYWERDFDWRAREAEINRFAQFRVDLGGRRVHFIHERGRGPESLAIVLKHRFPDSFRRIAKINPKLTHPPSHGGDETDAFDVVVPSLPGYGFSDAITDEAMIF
ncbi:MAG: epoxide hydrolase N-terminal domain-containing protein, partial [Gemmatimonadales bacterium]